MSGNSEVDAVLQIVEGGLGDTSMEGLIDPATVGAPPPPPPDMTAVRDARAEAREIKKASDEALREAIDHTLVDHSDTNLLRRLGKSWGRLVPNATTCRIYKRHESGPNVGHISMLGEWTIREIDADGDITSFIFHRLRPIHGHGVYFPYILDPKTNKEVKLGQVAVDGPAGAPSGQPSQNLQDNLTMMLFRDMQNQRDRAMSQTNQPPPNPLKMLVEAKQALKELAPEEKADSGGNPMLLMMMMQMQQAQVAASRPAVDPQLAALMDRMDRRLEALEKKAAEPPPLPPPPVPMSDPADTFAKMAAIFQPLIQQQPVRDGLGVREVLELVQAQNQNQSQDRLSLREILALVDRKPQETIHDKLQELIALRDLAANVAPAGGSETNFWDALGRLFEHAEFGSRLGDGLRAALAQPRTQVKVESRAVPSGAAAGNLPAESPPPAPAPAPAPAPKAPPPDQVVLPSSIQPHLDEIAKATTHEERIQGLVQVLTKMWGDKMWQPFVMEVLTCVAANEKEKALGGLGGFLALCARKNLLPEDAARQTYNDMKEHWERVQPVIAAEMARINKTASGGASPPPAPRPAPAPAPAQQAAPEAEEDDDGEEDDEEDDGDEGEEEPAAASAAPAPPSGPPLFVAEIPRDGIDALYDKAQSW